MTSKPPRYRAYLLRFWEVRSQVPGHPATWRFSLENAETGQKQSFPNLEALVAFLATQLEGNAEGPGSASDAERR